MKYIAASVLVLAGVSSAAPVAQVSLPSFSLPTGSSEDPPAPSATDAPGLGSGAGGISGGLGGLLGGGTGGGLSGGLGGLLGGSGTGSGSGSGGLTGGLSGLSGLSGLLGKGSSSGSGGLSGGLGDLLGGGSSGSGSEDESSPAVTSTPTGSGESTPAPTGSAGGGSIGENCTPQGSGSSSENGVKDKNCCTDITVIFARGTGELGNVGTVSGPPMFTSLREKLGADRVTVQGVDYPASTAGNSNLGRDGGPEMAELVKTALSQCPSTKVILSGYSQGAMVVHNAMSQGVSSSEVAGAILFGDPLKTQAVGDLPENKVQQFCGTSDFICGGGGDGGATGSHLSYGSVAGTAADFAISVAGLA